MAAEKILVNGATEILKGLSALVAKEIGLAWGVKDELQKLKKTVDMILAVMIDAEKKQVKSEAVKLWLEELKDIAYEAEDIMDEYAYEVMHRREMTRKRDKVRNFFSSSSAIVFRPKIAHEIKGINEKFNEIAKRKEKLGLQIIDLGMPSRTTNLDETSKLRETDSILDMSLKIVGRDNDKSKIINMLLHNDDPHNHNGYIQVIPIVGMGGLGKTTLAHLIYNDDKVNSHFELKMWVCVSNDFDVKTLSKKIIESITNTNCNDVSNIDVITRQLQQHLSGKKYLLVLDDVWNKKTEEWVRLRSPLLAGGSGSKIIVTTRSDNVASIMGGALHSYKLGILKENESWSLFKERVFGYVGGPTKTPTLITIGKELVEKCGGLPLAVIFLGSLLWGKDEIEWKMIKENQIWNESSNEDESRILHVLKLSYDHLPSHLKQCFSYFSLFPKDYLFARVKMISLWMAEGFILEPFEKNNKSMEEIGYEYFKILLNNSFFQDVQKDGVGQVLLFKMHDLVHDLAIEVAGHDREYLLLAAHENMKTIHNICSLRLLDFNEGMSKTVCKVLQDKTTLRTLLCNGTVKNVENAFDGLKRLRVLDLSETPNIEEISSSLMDNFRHLRFLDLSNTQIANLPKSLTRLYHLRTLRLIGCVNLKELPKGIGKLINLRHLMLSDDINMSREIGQLTSLRTLDPCNVGNNDMEDTSSSGGRGGGSCGIEVLEGLNLLSERLIINHLRNVRSGIEAQRANLMGKKNVNKIFLSWHKYASGGRIDDIIGEYSKEGDVLEALQPHSNMQMFTIDQYFGVKLPRWMGDPSCLPNVVCLQLNDCPNCEQLVGFGKLPSLKELKLFMMDGIKCLGNEFYYNSGGGGGVGSSSSSNSYYGVGAGAGAGAAVILFPSLKRLVLLDMGILEEWVDIPPTVSCFPCLEEIHIYNCPNLRITPTTCFPSLKALFLEEINGKLVVPLITANLNSLESVKLKKITELRLLPYRLLQSNKVKFVIVFDCLDFQGFLPSKEKEEEGLIEAFRIYKAASSTSLEVLDLVLLPALKFLPDVRRFTSLVSLRIKDCESLKPLPEDLTCLPSSLEHLKLVGIWNVKEVKDFAWQK